MLDQKMVDALLEASERFRSSWEYPKDTQTIFAPGEPLPVDESKIKDLNPSSQSPKTLCIM